MRKRTKTKLNGEVNATEYSTVAAVWMWPCRLDQRNKRVLWMGREEKGVEEQGGEQEEEERTAGKRRRSNVSWFGKLGVGITGYRKGSLSLSDRTVIEDR